MDEAGFILWQEDQDDPNGYDEIIENEAEMEELNDMIEENVEGYEEVHVMDQDTDVDNDDHQGYYNIDEGIISVPQENLIYLTDDGIVNGSSQIGVGMSHLIEQRVEEAENKIIGDEEVYTSTVEEVITEEDWIQSQGEEFVQVAMEQIVTSENQAEEDNDTVPLQTDQDEYTTSRPYPCDFCSRRFRKKANLMNHMVAHQNDRPHMCNLCGTRYVRRCDLINHLKIHAYNIDDDDLGEDEGVSTSGGKKKSSYDERLFRNDDHDEDLDHDDYDYDKNYDYNYYAKPTPPKVTVKKKSTPKVIPKRAPAAKTIKQIKKEKRPIVKQDPLNSFHGYDNDNSRHPSTSKPKDRTPEPYVEKYPITDDRKPFVCQHCGVSFTREKALESHKKMHEENEPSFDCEICGDSFYDNSALEEHLDSRHNYSQTVQKNKANKSATKPRARQQQPPMNTLDFDEDDSNSEYEPSKNNDEDDEDDDEGGFSCDRCEISFRNAVSLKRHIKTHFIKPELLSDDDLQDGASGAQFLCNVCFESFTEALDLLAHAEIHARFQPFKCQLCGETFFEENKIKIHLIDNHQGELTESSCKLCGKQCRDQRSLIKHSWEHSREKNHPCSKCGKTFHNKARLKRHISSHRNKSVMCEICHEEFPDGRSLMNHRHSHTKSNQFPCHECGKTFGSRSSQQIHIRIHTGERPYGCRFCWKAFADGGTLRKHERIHTGEKPYCCLVCPRAFNQRVVLREHIRSHHSAPDPDNGTTMTPYYCSLCGDLFPVSLDLIHHLIEHSDASTAAKRVPVTGPRKYKRRRKMKPDEYDASIDKSVENEYHSDVPVQKSSYKIKQEPLDFETVQQQHQNKQRESAMPYGDERSFMDPENYKIPEEIFQSTSASGSSNNRSNQLKSKKDDLMNELTTAVAKKKLKPGAARPKMIYTQKTRVAATDGKRKTKTMITKQVVQKQAKKEAPVSRQRQKARNEQSDDNDTDDDNYSMRYQTDIVNDLQEIMRSPSKTNDEASQNEEYYEDLDDEDALGRRRSRRRVVSKYGTTMKARKSLIKSPVNQKTTASKSLSSTSTSATKEDDIDLGIVKQEVEYEDHLCGICGESFKTRVQLLTHVPIHI